jgi:hypothetical protein
MGSGKPFIQVRGFLVRSAALRGTSLRAQSDCARARSVMPLTFHERTRA